MRRAAWVPGVYTGPRSPPTFSLLTDRGGPTPLPRMRTPWNASADWSTVAAGEPPAQLEDALVRAHGARVVMLVINFWNSGHGGLPREVRASLGDNLAWLTVYNCCIARVPVELRARGNTLCVLNLGWNCLVELPSWLGTHMPRLEELHVTCNYLLRLPPTLGQSKRLRLLAIGAQQHQSMLQFYRDEFRGGPGIATLHHSAIACYGYAPTRAAYALLALWRSRYKKKRWRVPRDLMRGIVHGILESAGSSAVWGKMYNPYA